VRQALLHGLEQLLQRDRLFQEVQRADAGGFDGGIDGGVAGHHDDRHGQQAVALPFLEQRDAVGIGHPDIEQHEVGHAGLAKLACLLRVFRSGHDMPSSPRISESNSRIPISSSTTRMLAMCCFPRC
jgi:hypothetical protein